MKKNFKLVLALVLSLMMVLASVSALAADAPTGSITIKPSLTVAVKTKNLSAYKILNATYSGTGEDQAVAYTVPAEMKVFYDEYFSTGTGEDKKTATQLAAAAGKTFDTYVVEQIAALDADKIVDFEYKALEAAATALTPISGAVDSDNIKFAGREPGYYVIKDNDTNEPISAVMLDTVTDANVDIVLKANDKTEKQIKTAGDLINDKANELGIGRDVEYVISQEIPNYRGYDYFYYLINDTLDNGLTFKPGTVVVKVGGETMVESADYHLYYVGDGHGTTAEFLNGKTFIVAFEDIVKNTKIEIGDAVEVSYNATVNANAIVGVNPNKNKVTVQYSNNPDKDQRGDYDNDHPGIPKNDENHPTGEGPGKFTDTYATKITVYKQDGKTKAKLGGVEFTLTGESQDVVIEGQDVFEEDETGDYWMLNDGTYTTTAPQEEATVEEIEDGSTGGWVEVQPGEDTAGKTTRTVGDKTYRAYEDGHEEAGVTVYKIIEPNSGDYASTTIKYKKTLSAGPNQETYEVSRVGTTANGTGDLVFSQLGAGSYTLTETQGLPGYNSIAPITFDIECQLPAATAVKDGTETATWSVTNVKNGTIEYDQTNGTFKITIDNNKGAELPSTGGIGTTIFYVAGSILVLAAAILLITKRRMGAED